MIKREQFNKPIEMLQQDISKLNTGRASPSLVEHILVESYSTKSPLVQLAAVSTPDPKTILIQPWDPGISKNIEKAIQQSSLGINPVNEGKVIRITVPPMTEERRRDLVKVLHTSVEACRVHIRGIREDIWKNLQKDKQAGTITEDQLFRSQKELQTAVDESNKLVKDIAAKKEEEIMTI